jgi:protein-disulfide isomerase
MAGVAALGGGACSRGAAATPAVQAAGSTPGDARQQFEASWAAQPRVETGVPADGAKVLIVKFNDWQCPSCKAAFLSYRDLLQKYAQTLPGVVKYVTKDYPLNSRCNAGFPSEQHPASCEAAAAVRIARDRGKGDEMATWLFDNQDRLTPAIVKTGAETIAGITDFDKQYPAVLPAIRQDAADGVALHIRFTPTFFINGVAAIEANGNWLPVEYFEMAVEYELKKAGVKR